MAYCFTLAPAFNEIALNWLPEIHDGYTIVKVFGSPYNFPGILSNAEQGSNALDAALHTYSGQTIRVWGHSMGADVIVKWLRDYGPAASSYASPANVRFYLTGNPERAYGGVYRVPAPPLGTFYAYGGTPGFPADTPYTVTDFARQYDFYADYPNVANPSLEAAFNASMLVHGDYSGVSLADPANTVHVEGNVSYILAPTPLDPAKRARVEQSYVRPAATLAPPLTPAPPTVTPVPLPAVPSAGDVTLPGDYVVAPADLYGDARAIAVAAERLSEERANDFEWVVTIHDMLWRPTGEIGDYMELTGTDPRNALPSATLKLKGEDEHIPLLAQCRNTLVGITVETAGLRFAYYVDTHEHGFDKTPDWTSTANCLGIFDVLNYMVVFPSWFLPIQIQPISHAVFFGPLCSVIETMIAECAMRIQTGIWEFVNNALSLNPDIRAWFGTLLQSNNGNIFEMLKTPVYVVRTNLFLDTSPQVAKTVRMQTCGQVITDLTKAYGVDVRVDLWKPGDAQPDPYANLTQVTYVVTVKDRSQIEGPTKTIIDSALRTAIDVEGSLLGKTLDPLLNPQGFYAPENVYIAPTLGVNFVQPYALFIAPRPGEKGSLTSFKAVDHTPKGWRQIIGGKSPKWLNDFINATTAWLIDSVSILLGVTGIPSNLLSGFLNDAFLAFQLIDHYSRRNEMGPYHPAMEKFTATNSAPLNIEALFSFINAFWDGRGYTSAIATFRNNEVYTLGRDVFRGGLASVAYWVGSEHKLFTDYIENVTYRVTATERDITAYIGDGKAEEAPLAKNQRFLTALQEGFNVWTLAPQS